MITAVLRLVTHCDTDPGFVTADRIRELQALFDGVKSLGAEAAAAGQGHPEEGVEGSWGGITAAEQPAALLIIRLFTHLLQVMLAGNQSV